MSNKTTDLISQWSKVGTYIVHSRISRPKIHKSKPDVVLIHGLGISSKDFIPLGKLLAEHYNVYIPDFPGFGKSSKPPYILNIQEHAHFLKAWIDEMGIKDPVFVGNSLGCQIILEFAHRYPDSINLGILNGPAMDMFRRGTIEQLLGFIKDSTVEPPHQTFTMLKDFKACGIKRLYKTFVYAINHPIKEKLPSINHQMVIVRGEDDYIVTDDWVQYLDAKLPNSELITIPRTGHTVNNHAPNVLFNIIRNSIND